MRASSLQPSRSGENIGYVFERSYSIHSRMVVGCKWGRLTASQQLLNAKLSSELQRLWLCFRGLSCSLQTLRYFKPFEPLHKNGLLKYILEFY